MSKYYRFIGKEDFVESTRPYIDLFLKKYDLAMDFTKPAELKKLDTMINSGAIDPDADYLGLAAIIGEFYIVNIRAAYWYFTTYGASKMYAVIRNDNALYSPVDILEMKIEKLYKRSGLYLIYNSVKADVTGFYAQLPPPPPLAPNAKADELMRIMYGEFFKNGK